MFAICSDIVKRYLEHIDTGSRSRADFMPAASYGVEITDLVMYWRRHSTWVATYRCEGASLSFRCPEVQPGKEK